MSYTDFFLSEIDGISQERLSGKVRDRMKLALLDYLGVTLAGAKTIERKTDSIFSNTDIGAYSAIGCGRNVPIENAVFLNGLNAHALDFDDGTNTGIIHLGSPLFSMLLPLSQKAGLNGQQLLHAAWLGYEASFTLAVSIQPKHKALGYHATGTCGTLGAALSMGYALNFSKEQLRNTFSAAAVSASGMLKVLDDGSQLKPYNAAKAALMGYIAARVGQAGFVGPDDVLGGDRGFLKIMTGENNIELSDVLLNGTSAVEKAYIKPYAACRYCHPSIEAAIRLKDRYGIKPDCIKEIRVRTYYLAVNKHDHTDIKGASSAKMSIPYSVAVGYIKGKAGLNEYSDEMASTPEILALTKRIKVESDDEFSKNFPKLTTALLELRDIDGNVYTERIDYPKGEPENPLSSDEVIEKFSALALFAGKTIGEIEAIVDATFDVENKLDGLRELIR